MSDFGSENDMQVTPPSFSLLQQNLSFAEKYRLRAFYDSKNGSDFVSFEKLL